MKPITNILLVIIMSFLFPGCGNNANPSPSYPSYEEEEPQTPSITIFKHETYEEFVYTEPELVRGTTTNSRGQTYTYFKTQGTTTTHGHVHTFSFTIQFGAELPYPLTGTYAQGDVRNTEGGVYSEFYFFWDWGSDEDFKVGYETHKSTSYTLNISRNSDNIIEGTFIALLDVQETNTIDLPLTQEITGEFYLRY